MKTGLVFISDGIANEAFLLRHLAVLWQGKDDVIALALERTSGVLSGALQKLHINCEGLSASRLTPQIRHDLIKNADFVIAFWDGQSMSDVLFEARLQNKPTKVIPVPTTKVVNRDRGDEFDFYIGRGTPWGNPFVLGSGEGKFSRDQSISKYIKYFEESILTDPAKVRGLLSMRGCRLACHCKPLACHGDVIAHYLNSLDPQFTIEAVGDESSSGPEEVVQQPSLPGFR